MKEKADQKKPANSAKIRAEDKSEALCDRCAGIERNGAPLADVQVMKIGYFDPDERARAKARSRAKDDEDLKSGRITREELQRINGGGGIFKNSRISHRPRFKGSVKLRWPEDK